MNRKTIALFLSAASVSVGGMEKKRNFFGTPRSERRRILPFRGGTAVRSRIPMEEDISGISVPPGKGCFTEGVSKRNPERKISFQLARLRAGLPGGTVFKFHPEACEWKNNKVWCR